LHCSNINIIAIDLKGSKEKETTKAKKVDYFKVSFDIDENRVTPSGNKALMVCIYHPDGSISVSAGSFTDRNGKTIQYTNKVDINYEQGKNKLLVFNGILVINLRLANTELKFITMDLKLEKAKSLSKSTFLGL
jgi:hypothetical protein